MIASSMSRVGARAALVITLTALLCPVTSAQDLARTTRQIELDERISGLQIVRQRLHVKSRPIRVLAQLSEATAIDGGSTSRVLAMSGISSQQLRRATRAAIDRLRLARVSDIEEIDGLPLVAFVVDSDQLSAMAESGQFASIVEDRLSRAYLASSGDVMDVPALHALGVRGDGHTVAVLDTGVDIDHPFLNGRVIEGACYSSNVPTYGATSVCPGGAEAVETLVAGNHCTGVDGCDHGTHVAGIAAGRASASITINGVAPDANIMAVQVFSRFDDTPGGPMTCDEVGLPSPCILSFTSDQIRGLQRVLSRAATINVSAVNMSLGGGNFPATCDTQETALKVLMDELLAQGIATVVAAGNDGLRSGIGAPSCISTAVAVGSTTDADTISSFSNLSSTVDVLAPGSSIESSVPGTGFANFNGTSMATPQVAGAIAALASCNSGPSVDAIVAALEATGTSVTDTRSGGSVTKNRVDLDAAATQLGCLPAAPLPPDADSDCVAHDLGNLRVASRGWWFWRTWSIVDGGQRLFYFGGRRAQAQQALGIMRDFGLNSTCFVGRPDPSMQYLRAGNSVPGGSHGNRDCRTFDRQNVTISGATGGGWQLRENATTLLRFPSEAEAQHALRVVQQHRLNRQCAVGRPDPSFTYWLAE